MANKFIYVIISLFLLCSCNNKKEEKPLAKVGNGYYLYLSDLNDILSENTSKEDSAIIIADYTARWIHDKLVLMKAEENLSKTEKDVSQELDSYRASLLVHRYEQEYLNQRMDTVVRANEIETFYENNKDNFLLIDLLVKGIYIKVPNDAPYVSNLKKLIRSNKEADLEELEKTCIQVATKFDQFTDKWVDFTTLANELPKDGSNYENLAIKAKYFEDSDDTHTYIVRITDIITKGSKSPLEHVRESIKAIILNRRKNDMINKLRQNIFNEGVRQNTFKNFVEN